MAERKPDFKHCTRLTFLSFAFNKYYVEKIYKNLPDCARPRNIRRPDLLAAIQKKDN